MACWDSEWDGAGFPKSERGPTGPNGDPSATCLLRRKAVALVERASPRHSGPCGANARHRKWEEGTDVAATDKVLHTEIMAEAMIPSPRPSRAKRAYVKKSLAAYARAERSSGHRRSRGWRQAGGLVAQLPPSSPEPLAADLDDFTPPRTRTRLLLGGSTWLRPSPFQWQPNYRYVQPGWELGGQRF
jgi:hypothetical protein